MCTCVIVEIAQGAFLFSLLSLQSTVSIIIILAGNVPDANHIHRYERIVYLICFVSPRRGLLFDRRGSRSLGCRPVLTYGLANCIVEAVDAQRRIQIVLEIDTLLTRWLKIARAFSCRYLGSPVAIICHTVLLDCRTISMRGDISIALMNGANFEL